MLITLNFFINKYEAALLRYIINSEKIRSPQIKQLISQMTVLIMKNNKNKTL